MFLKMSPRRLQIYLGSLEREEEHASQLFRKPKFQLPSRKLEPTADHYGKPIFDLLF